MTQKISVSLTVNGQSRTVSALPDTPLLWVLREELKLGPTPIKIRVRKRGS